MPLRIYIDPILISQQIVAYVFRLIAKNKNFEIIFVNDVMNADIKITSDSSGDFHISKSFYEKLMSGKTEFKNYFFKDCIIKDENGNDDLISSIFYCVNSIQEYNVKSEDELGRFQYKDSYQFQYNNVLENSVQQMIDKVCQHVALSSKIKTKRKSKFFLTHDIDSIHGAWKEDGFHAFKHLNPGKLFSVLLNEALGKPDWLSMDMIRKIEDENGFRSTFYWLLYKDKMNADYNFKGENVQRQFTECGKRGWENGLHKSLRSASFNEEIQRLGIPATGNRFHYLNFNLPGGYKQVEAAGIKLDTSLGFYEHWGFRNNYGLPFMPFNLEEKRVLNLVEVPMQIMDRTFFTKQMRTAEVEKLLIDWFEKNKHDCVFTINFHNNFFSEMKYAGYIGLYKSLLAYFRESEFEPATQSELISEFYNPEKIN